MVADNSGREKLLAEAQAELDRQIGLTRVKEQIEAYRAATQMAKIRAARGMKVAQPSKHMIFAGPPGTGKTTIARVVANILAGLGVIAEPKLVESSRKDFVAEYEGQSAVKTSRTIDRAVGGVLFIDEAYTLVQERDGRADPFGTEALDTLLARMENDRDRLVVIIAGYSADIDRLLESNDGLRSRFATRIEFDSYSPDEIVDIAKVIAGANDSTLDEEAAKRVLEAATLLSQRSLNGKPALDIAGNGRYARQLVEAGEQSRDMRLARSLDFDSLGVEQLSEINGEDMAAAISAIHARAEYQRVTDGEFPAYHQGAGQRLALPAAPRRARDRAARHPDVRRSAAVLQPGGVRRHHHRGAGLPRRGAAGVLQAARKAGRGHPSRRPHHQPALRGDARAPGSCGRCTT